jgi:beta-glucosidase
MCVRFRLSVPWIAGLVLAAGMARMVQAQAGYPFRDSKLTDDQRIADLLGRLTLDEKVDLMANHPKIPRLGIVFSGQVEGLHGLALGGPGGWGPRGKQPLPTTTFPQEKGLGETWTRNCSRDPGPRGYEARYYYWNPVTDFGGVGSGRPTPTGHDPRWGRTEESTAKTLSWRPVDEEFVSAHAAGARSEALAGGLADEAFPGQ